MKLECGERLELDVQVLEAIPHRSCLGQEDGDHSGVEWRSERKDG